MKKYLVMGLLAVSFVIITTPSLAQPLQGATPTSNTSNTCDSTGCKIANPLGSVSSPQLLIGKVINGVLGVVGSIALLMFIYGGFMWMTAAGSSERVSKGKEVIVWATIGLVVIFSAYAMVRFVFNDILGVGSATPTSQISTSRNV